MRITGGAACSVCNTPRPFEALLAITDLFSGKTHHVCRPGIDGHSGACFRKGTCWSGHQSIEIAHEPAQAARPKRSALPEHIRQYAVAR